MQRGIAQLIGPLAVMMLLAGCGNSTSPSSSAPTEESVCTKVASTIAEIEKDTEAADFGMGLPPNGASAFEVGGWGLSSALQKLDPNYSSTFAKDDIQPFLDVAGQCLSENAYEYLTLSLPG